MFPGAGKRTGLREPRREASRATMAYGKDTDKNMSLSDAYELLVLLGVSATLLLILTSSQIPQATDGDTGPTAPFPTCPPAWERGKQGGV